MDLYRKNYSLYSNFTNGMQEYITDLLTKNGIRVQAIVSRVKEETSLQNKINKHPQKYNYIEEVTDLCGLRIITYFEDDVDLMDIWGRSFFVNFFATTPREIPVVRSICRIDNPSAFNSFSIKSRSGFAYDPILCGSLSLVY